MPQRLSAFSPVLSRDGTITRDSFLKNGIVEFQPEAPPKAKKRPGLSLFSTSTSGLAQGMAVFYDGDNYRLYQSQSGKLYTSGGLKINIGLFSSPTYSVNPTSPAGNSYYQNAEGQVLVKLGGVTYLIGFNAARTRFLVFYSYNGKTWNSLLDVASGGSYPTGDTVLIGTAHGSLITIMNGSLANQCWTSPNGIDWTLKTGTTGITLDTYSNKMLSDGTNLFVFRNNKTNANNPIYKSTNGGTTWATVAVSGNGYNDGGVARNSYAAWVLGTTLYVGGGTSAGGGKKIYSSTNQGVNWSEVGTDVLSFYSTTAGGGASATLDGTTVIFTEWTDDNNYSGRVYSSSNLTTWTQIGKLGVYGDDGGDTDIFISEAAAAVSPETIWFNQSYIVCWYDGQSGLTWGGSNRVMTHPNVGAGVVSSLVSLGLGKLDFSQNYARTLLAIKSQSQAWTLTVPGHTLTAITDPDYPAQTTRGLVYLDGFFFVMDTDGNIWNSAAEDFTSWNATQFIAAEFEPDNGVCLAKYLNYVVAFGDYTTEFFYNAGNAVGSPLSPVQNGVMTVGCAHGDTVQTMDGEIFFVGRMKSGGQSAAAGRMVAKLAGTGHERLSTPDIDRILDADDFADVDACTFKVGGHSYYMIRLGTSRITLVADLTLKQWYIWTQRRTSFTKTMAGVVTASGTATWIGTHSFSDGDVGVVTGFSGTHTALNGTFNLSIPGTSTATMKWWVGTGYSGTSSGTGTSTGWIEEDFPASFAVDFAGRQLLQDKDNGKVYVLSEDTYQDDGIYMDFINRLQKVDLGANERKFVAWADYVSDRQSGNVMMRHSDDDGQSWTRYRSRSLSGERTRWHRLGNFRRRLLEFRVTDNIPIRGVDAIELEVS